MRHREIDRAGVDAFGPLAYAPGQAHRGLRTADDLDVAPRKRARDADPQRLSDRFLCRETSRIGLGRIRARVAVVAFGRREAPFAEARIALERPAHARDLDQVDAHARHTLS